MAKIKVSKVEPNEKELKAKKLIEKEIGKIKAIEKGGKAKVATKTKRTRKTKDEDIEK